MSEFVIGQALGIDWSKEGICCCDHSDKGVVVFIGNYNETHAKVCYPTVDCSIAVGYVPYLALSSEDND